MIQIINIRGLNYLSFPICLEIGFPTIFSAIFSPATHPPIIAPGTGIGKQATVNALDKKTLTADLPPSMTAFDVPPCSLARMTSLTPAISPRVFFIAPPEFFNPFKVAVTEEVLFSLA